MPNQTDLFFYFAAFITVVLGLAVGDMVTSLHRLLRAGRRVRWSVTPAIAILFVFLSVLSQFFTIWEMLGPTRFTFYGLVGAMTAPVAIALAALAVLPDEVGDGAFDLEAFYLNNRLYIHGVLLLAFLADCGYELLKLDVRASGFAFEAMGVTLPNLIACGVFVALARSRSRKLHLGGLGLLLLLGLIGYGLYDVALPAA